jgi:K+-sensing histidine kinase KdpD
MTQIEQIYESLTQLFAHNSINDICREAVIEAVTLVKAEYGTIFLADENDNLVRVYSSSNKKSYTTPRKGGFNYKAYKKQEFFVFTPKEIALYHPHLLAENIKSYITVPLAYQKKSVGTLNLVSTKPRHFSKSRLNFLKLLGSLITLRIQNAQLLKEQQEALRTRDLFIAMASHELKTPITTITVYAQLINKRLKENKPPDVKWALGLEEEVLQLKTLTTELLETNRIKRGSLEMKLTPTTLETIIVRAIANFEAAFPKHRLRYKPGKEKTIITADREKLLQVFNNILSNAGKFSPKNSTVTIKVEVDNKNALITISDQGAGIPKKDIPHIFDQYYRGIDQKKEGLGLGLYISKNIIEEHNGTITISSNADRGTTISIQLPKGD